MLTIFIGLKRQIIIFGSVPDRQISFMLLAVDMNQKNVDSRKCCNSANFAVVIKCPIHTFLKKSFSICSISQLYFLVENVFFHLFLVEDSILLASLANERRKQTENINDIVKNSHDVIHFSGKETI